MGFSAEAEAAVWRVDSVSLPATGLAPGDRIVLINGTEARSAADLRDTLRQNAASQLLVERAGVPLELSYERPALVIDWHYLILALIGIGYLFIGFYTLLRDQRRAARLFYLWCLTSGLVYVASAQAPFDAAAKIVYVFEELARILLAPLTLHLFLVFPRPLKRLQNRLGWLPFLYVPAAFLALLQADLIFAGGRFLLQGQIAAATGTLDQLVLFHLVSFALVAAAVLISRLRQRRDSEPLRQAAWIAAGMLGGYLPFLVLYLLPRTLGFDWPRLLTTAAVLPLAFVPLTFAYAILRYKLWDIGVVIRDTLSLATTVLIGVLGFSLVNLVVQRAVPEGLAYGRTMLSFTSGLLIAGLMIPTRRRIGASLERLQYGGAFRRRRGLLDFGREMLEERDLDKLSKALLGELAATFDLGRANLFLGETERLSIQHEEPGVPRRLRPADFDEEFWDSDVRSLSGVGMPSEVNAVYRLHAAGYRYAFPLTSRRRRIGVLVLGYKKDEIALSSADIDLVRNLLSQVSLAIDNAFLLGQIHKQLDHVSKLQETTEEILESSPAGIAVVAADGTIERANAALAGLFESTPETLVGRSLAEMLGRGPLPRAGDRLREMRFESPSGEDHYLQVSVATPGQRPRRRIRRARPRRERADRHRERSQGARAPRFARHARGRRGTRGEHADHRHLELRADAPPRHSGDRSALRPAAQGGAPDVPRLAHRQQPARVLPRPPARLAPRVSQLHRRGVSRSPQGAAGGEQHRARLAAAGRGAHGVGQRRRVAPGLHQPGRQRDGRDERRRPPRGLLRQSPRTGSRSACKTPGRGSPSSSSNRSSNRSSPPSSRRGERVSDSRSATTSCSATAATCASPANRARAAPSSSSSRATRPRPTSPCEYSSSTTRRYCRTFSSHCCVTRATRR